MIRSAQALPNLNKHQDDNQRKIRTHSEGSSLETLRHMVASGLGITILPLSAAIGTGYKEGLLVTRPFAGPAPCRTSALAWRASFPRHKAIDALRDAIKHHPLPSLPCSRMTEKTLDQIPVTQLKGVGTQLAGKLTKLGIHTIQDILFHLPMRYMDRTRITPIGSAQLNTDVVIEGEIRGCDLVYGRRRSLMCRIQDNTRPHYPEVFSF